MSAFCDLPTIDVHGRFGQYVKPGIHTLLRRYMSGAASEVVARAKPGHIRYTVASLLRAHSRDTLTGLGLDCPWLTTGRLAQGGHGFVLDSV